MAANVVIGIYLISALLALSSPKFAILLFWPLLYCYPHWLLFGKLPMNIGLDDVFIVCLFVGSLIKGGNKIQVKWPLIMAFLFWVIFVLGDVSSVVTGHLKMALAWQQWLKSLGTIFFVYSLCVTMTTPKQIQRAIYSFLFGAILGSISIIYYTLFPYTYNPFQIPYWVLGQDAHLRQTIGAFGDTALAAGVLGFAILIGYFYIRLAKDRLKRPVILIVTGILVFALVLSTARKGWLFVMIPVVFSTLFSKQRTLGILLLGGITLIVAAAYTYFSVFSERVAWMVWQAGGDVQDVTSGRFVIWMEHLSHPKISWLFCGEGFAIWEGLHVHNNFLGILMGMGLAGVVLWTVNYVKVFKKSLWIRKYDTIPNMAILFNAVFWSYIGYFVYCMVSTPVQWPNVRYIDFFLMTLVCVRYKQLEVEEQYSYQDELESEYSYDDQFEEEYEYQDIPAEPQLYYDW
ncbi:MAG: O-antigen ligase family protein [Planctomycetes bacterium]|nr:O-antigen ligase family protein [Planctomycetota bacterium]